MNKKYIGGPGAAHDCTRMFEEFRINGFSTWVFSPTSKWDLYYMVISPADPGHPKAYQHQPPHPNR